MTQPAALLIVDVQRDFCPGGALAVPHGDTVVPVLNRCIAAAVRERMPVYASRDWHPSMSRHFKAHGGAWPPHCVQETEGARFHPALQLPADAIVITKGDTIDAEGYSALEGRTPEGRLFADDLRARGIAHLYVGGLATDYCVRASVVAARDAGFEVSVLTDAVAAIDLKPGDADRALAEMHDAGATVTTAASWLRPRLP